MASRNDRDYIARSGTSATNSTAVALTAATAKSVVGVLGSANDTIAIRRWRVSFNSVTASDAPALVELGVISALGTMTSFTPSQLTGRTLSSSCTAGYNATVEPTYVRLIDSLYIPVNNGLYEFYWPLSDEPQADASQGFAIRVTAPQAQSCYAAIVYSE